ncbi:MAG: bifunctional pyr operon transcriptional regulator/uracil phosphoribosyltransferase PyrR [Bacteroidia bacterium]
MKPRIIVNEKEFQLTIQRLCHQLIENHDNFENSVIIGLQPRGIYLAKRICKELKKITGNSSIACGFLDVTFYRDDFRRRDDILIPKTTEIDFIIENKNVILIDDVLFTGRTIRSGLDAMLDFGRPKLVELLVFIDRRFSRHLPIQPTYVGKTVDTVTEEKVKVSWKETDGEDCVYLFTSKEN